MYTYSMNPTTADLHKRAVTCEDTMVSAEFDSRRPLLSDLRGCGAEGVRVHNSYTNATGSQGAANVRAGGDAGSGVSGTQEPAPCGMTSTPHLDAIAYRSALSPALRVVSSDDEPLPEPEGEREWIWREGHGWVERPVEVPEIPAEREVAAA